MPSRAETIEREWRKLVPIPDRHDEAAEDPRVAKAKAVHGTKKKQARESVKLTANRKRARVDGLLMLIEMAKAAKIFSPRSSLARSCKGERHERQKELIRAALVKEGRHFSGDYPTRADISRVQEEIERQQELDGISAENIVNEKRTPKKLAEPTRRSLNDGYAHVLDGDEECKDDDSEASCDGSE